MDTHKTVLLTFVALVAVAVIVFLVWPKSKGKEGYNPQECEILKNNLNYQYWQDAAQNEGDLVTYYSQLPVCDAECAFQMQLAQQAQNTYQAEINTLNSTLAPYCNEPINYHIFGVELGQMEKYVPYPDSEPMPMSKVHGIRQQLAQGFASAPEVYA